MTKELILSQGLVTLVDDEDYKWLGQWKWSAFKVSENLFYTLRRGRMGEERRGKSILLHREILQAPSGMTVDHINGNGLDNQRNNLRLATHAENMRNSHLPINNTSGYKGVSWRKIDRKWGVHIGVNNKVICLGGFDDLEEAARVYDEAAKKYHGEFAKLNFQETE